MGRLILLLPLVLLACGDDELSSDGGTPRDTAQDAPLADAPGDVDDVSVSSADAERNDGGSGTRDPQLCIALTLGPGATSLAGSYRVAAELGMTEPGDINVDWNAFETEPNIFVAPDSEFGEEIGAFNGLYRNAEAATLTFAPIQTTALVVPGDLVGEPWDSPALITRYIAALDNLLARYDLVPIDVVSVGNEVDIVLQRADEIQAYSRLVSAVREHLRGRGIAVGVKFTRDAIETGRVDPVLDVSDIAIASYYPLGFEGDPWRVRPTSVVVEELHSLADAVAPRPLFLAEVGYPSSAINGSGLAEQSDFTRRVFDFWQTRQSDIRSVCFVWLYDLPMAVVVELARFYGIEDEGFVSYLATLGLFDGDGNEKPAVDALRNGFAGL